MKSIKAKLCYFLSFLLLTFFSIGSTFAQTEGVPTDAEVAELTASPDARLLSNYFASQGYSNAGLDPASSHTYESIVDDATANRSSLNTSGSFKRPIKIRIIIIIIIHKKAGAESIAQSITAEKREAVDAPGNITTAYDAIGENSTTDFKVVGGRVLPAAKSLSSFLTRFTNCWNQYFTGTATDCTACYNCLKSCFSGSGWWASKLWCALWNCSGKCIKCVTSIYNFYKCVKG